MHSIMNTLWLWYTCMLWWEDCDDEDAYSMTMMFSHATWWCTLYDVVVLLYTLRCDDEDTLIISYAWWCKYSMMLIWSTQWWWCWCILYDICTWWRLWWCYLKIHYDDTCLMFRKETVKCEWSMPCVNADDDIWWLYYACFDMMLIHAMSWCSPMMMQALCSVKAEKYYLFSVWVWRGVQGCTWKVFGNDQSAEVISRKTCKVWCVTGP